MFITLLVLKFTALDKFHIFRVDTSLNTMKTTFKSAYCQPINSTSVY